MKTLCKNACLNAYYALTLPYRTRVNRAEAAEGRAPVIVLYYHRVADDLATPWTATPAMFARQIRWLKKRFDLVTLAEAQQRIRTRNQRPAVHITFDDGYADNCRDAIPLRIRERVPCTYFVCTHHVLKRTYFQHDVAMGCQHAPNTIEQLREMAAAGIEIGAHTRTHADLGKINDPAVLHDELIAAGEDLQAALGRPVRYFAFPYGMHANLNTAAFHLAYEYGYDAVCSAYGGYNFPGDDAYHLQRIPVGNDMAHLRNWTTVDPRKRGVRRFFYGPCMAPPAAMKALKS